MGTSRELLDQTSLLYLENMEQCLRHSINSIFNSTNEATKNLYEWTRLVLTNCENVCATNASGILFVSLISLSHFMQNSMFIHWKESNGLNNINLFGLVVGLSGENI